MNRIRTYSVPIVVICFIVLCIRLTHAYYNDYATVEDAYRSGLSVNLDSNVKAESIKQMLLQRGYYTDEQDAELVSCSIADSLRMGRELESLYDFRKNSWKIPTDTLCKYGGERLRCRVVQAKRNTCIEYNSSGTEQSMVDLSSGVGRIAVRVVEEDSSIAGVLVCLRHHFFDSNLTPCDSIYAVAITSSTGEAVFNGLDTAFSYSVLPSREGFEYGGPQGTVGGTLGSTARTTSGFSAKVASLFNRHYGDLRFTYEQKQLRVPLFNDAILRLIHEDCAFTLRTPQQWKTIVARSAAWFLIPWLVLIFVMWRRRRSTAVYWPVAALMGITGLGLLGMLSYNNPFTDKLLATDYLTGVVVGVTFMVFFQYFDLKKFYRSSMFDRLGSMVNRKGLGWFAVALLLTLMLFTPLGRSVGGMAVNLKIGPLMFQPSEIAKYLMVFFMSAWFCRKADTLIGYSDEGNISLSWNKVRHVSSIFIALFCMLLIYMILGDMGPGLVLLFSFIIIYSIVKSRPSFESTGGGFIKGVVKSDIFMLMIGVLSFFFIVWLGSFIHLSGLFASLWFVVWIFFWAIAKHQIVETPIMANAVIAVFMFAKNLPGSIGDRFAMRGEMCSNPWGNLGLDGSLPHPTPNGQVAEGLWGLASGGFCGQGFSSGMPSYIPAFHTDMVLSSLGEQMGLVGIVVAVLLLLAVLHHTIAVGLRSRHYFSFFVCVGIAVFTAVQFTIIALGSTGVIPLTGVAVPLLSYGKVSMIMTLVAFGIVLSVEAHTFAPSKDNAADLAAEKLFQLYDAPVAMTRTSGFILMLFIICVFAYTALLHRNSTLVHPLYVTTQRGENLVQYNPRIDYITRALHPGNIYDRNGILLATSIPDSVHVNDYAKCGVYSDELQDILSRRTRRYYPLGNRLLFVVGDVNSQYPFAYNESSPLGYLAESQHMSYLRGFDNVLYTDKEHTNPCYVDIISDNYRADLYQPSVEHATNRVVLRDYTKLLPLLKAGRNSKRVERVNKRKSRFIQPHDLHLTVDATLQCILQNRIASYIDEKFPNHRLMRISAVVLDSQSGDFLASALYPLPNKDTLITHANDKYYDDSRLAPAQKAYTDRDLGLTYFTPPGSTAKVMTALAGLQKEGRRAALQEFFVPAAEQVEVGIEPIGNVSMEHAIVYSSNCYFIHLLNHLNLYSALDSIYAATGAQLGGSWQGKTKIVTPYLLHFSPMNEAKRTVWKNIVSWNETNGLARYQSYVVHRAQNPRKMNDGLWQWAWGQGTLATTPLGMTRVASTVVNGGVMPKTRYRIDEDIEEGIRLVSSESAGVLKGYMHTMAEKANGNPSNAIHDSHVGGKTGTPERKRMGKTYNDGWFIFYVDDCLVRLGSRSEHHPLAIAVRMEREVGSGPAMCLSRDVILPVLKELGYYNNN